MACIWAELVSFSYYPTFIPQDMQMEEKLQAMQHGVQNGPQTLLAFNLQSRPVGLPTLTTQVNGEQRGEWVCTVRLKMLKGNLP